MAAATGSSTGSNGDPASEITVRSACLPGDERADAVVQPEHAGAAEGRELEGLRGRQGIGPALASPRGDDRRTDLLEQVERRRRGGAVGCDRDGDAGIDENLGAARRRSRDSRLSAGSARRLRRGLRAAQSPRYRRARSGPPAGAGPAVPRPRVGEYRFPLQAAPGTRRAGSSRRSRRRASRARPRSRRNASPVAGRVPRTRDRRRSCTCTGRGGRRRGARGPRARARSARATRGTARAPGRRC